MEQKKLNEIYCLSRHKASTGLTNTQLATSMNSFQNWQWSAVELDNYFTGKRKLKNSEKLEAIIRYLAWYYIENL